MTYLIQVARQNLQNSSVRFWKVVYDIDKSRSLLFFVVLLVGCNTTEKVRQAEADWPILAIQIEWKQRLRHFSEEMLDDACNIVHL